MYGWHDLQGRLVERSRDFREAYRDLVREYRYEQYVDALTHTVHIPDFVFGSPRYTRISCTIRDPKCKEIASLG